MTVIERLEALAGQRLQYRCVECLTVGVEQWAVCASCASERPPRRVDLYAELLEQTAADLLKIARAASEEHLSRPCRDMRCQVCMSAQELFREVPS